MLGRYGRASLSGLVLLLALGVSAAQAEVRLGFSETVITCDADVAAVQEVLGRVGVDVFEFGPLPEGGWLLAIEDLGGVTVEALLSEFNMLNFTAVVLASETADAAGAGGCGC